MSDDYRLRCPHCGGFLTVYDWWTDPPFPFVVYCDSCDCEWDKDCKPLNVPCKRLDPATHSHMPTDT